MRCRGGGVTTAAASALATATAGHSLWLADVLFSCATAYGIALFGVLVAGLLVPHASRASAWTRAVVATLWTFLPLEVLYLTLLVRHSSRLHVCASPDMRKPCLAAVSPRC